jgi:hypothetical protein
MAACGKGCSVAFEVPLRTGLVEDADEDGRNGSTIYFATRLVVRERGGGLRWSRGSVVVAHRRRAVI